MEKSIVGDLINFRGLVYSPMNENGVIFLFGKVIEDLNMYIEEIKPGFPDCIGRRFTGKGWEKIRIEFEFRSKHFLDHGHDPKNCDLIVCWEHNWDECPIEVLELKDIIQGLPTKPIIRPDSSLEDKKYTLDRHYKGSSKLAIKLFNELDEEIKKIREEVYRKIAKSAITFYSPERVFAYTYLQANRIKIDLFTRGNKIANVKNYSPDEPKKGGAKWGYIYISKKEDVPKAITAIRQAYVNVREAIKINERTGWYAPVELENTEE